MTEHRRLNSGQTDEETQHVVCYGEQCDMEVRKVQCVTINLKQFIKRQVMVSPTKPFFGRGTARNSAVSTTHTLSLLLAQCAYKQQITAQRDFQNIVTIRFFPETNGMTWVSFEFFLLFPSYFQSA